MEAMDEIVLMEEIDDARDERDRSEIMLSGLERDDALAIEGLRDVGYAEGAYGNCSMAQRLKPACWAMAIAEQIDGRRDTASRTLTAGVFEATDDGVSCGVGSGPWRARAGVGGAPISTRGSKTFGKARGVLSLDSDSRAAKEFLVGVGVAGEENCQLPVDSCTRLGVYGIGTVSSSGVRIGTTLFHVNMPDPGEGGCALGVYLSTKSVHRLKIASGM